MPYGAYVSEAGAWWEAMKADGNEAEWMATDGFLTASDYETQRRRERTGS